jgi:hypothetical protein
MEMHPEEVHDYIQSMDVQGYKIVRFPEEITLT